MNKSYSLLYESYLHDYLCRHVTCKNDFKFDLGGIMASMCSCNFMLDEPDSPVLDTCVGYEKVKEALHVCIQLSVQDS